MRWKNAQAAGDEEARMDLMPMIDIIFQLLIFFLLSAKFIAFEGQLQAYLPKDRGLSSPPSVPLVNVTFDFQWKDADLRVVCHTFGYHPPGGGAPQDTYRFADDPGVGEGVDAQGRRVVQTETVVGAPGGKPGRVTYDYAAPDFREIEEYLGHRKRRHDEISAGTKLPVTVNTSDGVPWQMVVNMIDMCGRLGITDFAINAEGVEN